MLYLSLSPSVSLSLSSLHLLRVLDETLQKLVHLVQEEECVSWSVM